MSANGAARRLGAVALLLAGLAPGSVDARVEIKTGADGRKMISEESPTHYSHRTADQLRPVPGGSQIAALINHHARLQGLSPRLVQAVVQVESGYNPKARSRKGAMGLMQLMPETAKSLRVSNPYDPGQNIRGGTTYLRRQLDRFSGDMTLALAAYNAGPTAVARYKGVPPYRETRNYVNKVLSLYRSSVPAALREQARDVAKQRQRKAAASAAAEPPNGSKVYVSRGANNRLKFTTAPPGSS